jgi:xylulokinase
MARSVMEGVTYNLRESLEIFRELRVPISEIRASGGGAKSVLWRQIQADVFGQPVVTLNAEQGPAYGVALLAAVGCGAYASIQEACGAAIRVVSQTRPNQVAQERYERGFAIYRGLYGALKTTFRDIAAM